MPDRPVIYHIPVCPFCQRIEILLDLKGLRDAVDFHVIDITKPRPDWFLEMTGGRTAMPVLQDERGRILYESRVLLDYIEDRFGTPAISRGDPYERAVERLMMSRDDDFTWTGYKLVLKREGEDPDALRQTLLDHYRWFNGFLEQHNPGGTWLFDRFGMAEVLYTPVFQRFWFLEYYDGFSLPDDPAFSRVKAWQEACLAHPAVQQVTFEQIVKLYYDYAVGSGNGALPKGRQVSSFAFEPDWRDRPMPPRDTSHRIATDEELGLVPD